MKMAFEMSLEGWQRWQGRGGLQGEDRSLRAKVTDVKACSLVEGVAPFGPCGDSGDRMARPAAPSVAKPGTALMCRQWGVAGQGGQDWAQKHGAGQRLAHWPHRKGNWRAGRKLCGNPGEL